MRKNRLIHCSFFPPPSPLHNPTMTTPVPTTLKLIETFKCTTCSHLMEGWVEGHLRKFPLGDLTPTIAVLLINDFNG